ncbi:SAM-dependent methyltransferase [Anopheles sinensis]|uniref:SAM-dependent methyltransferase n=1 Tax=Anopheles sinensis TaxID=74873 RepID=A0A084W8V5_ANOSI|nr:SAM-dependent methyltransferase [Anopheles sinensis]
MGLFGVPFAVVYCLPRRITRHNFVFGPFGVSVPVEFPASCACRSLPVFGLGKLPSHSLRPPSSTTRHKVNIGRFDSIFAPGVLEKKDRSPVRSEKMEWMATRSTLGSSLLASTERATVTVKDSSSLPPAPSPPGPRLRSAGGGNDMNPRASCTLDLTQDRIVGFWSMTIAVNDNWGPCFEGFSFSRGTSEDSGSVRRCDERLEKWGGKPLKN